MSDTAPSRRPAPRPRLSAALLWAAFAAGALILFHGPVSFSAERGSPRVVASVKPVHSLAAFIMAGVGEPKLLISGADSPHTHALRPSEAKALHGADVLFWVGPSLEASFAEPIAALVQGKVISLLREPGVTVYPVRPAGSLPQDLAASPGEPGREAPGVSDPHIWLDPANARAIARAIAAALESADPAHAATYAANAAALDEKLAALDAELADKLTPVRGVPFIVYHDAYQYLERRYGLNPIASVTLSPEQAPGARRIKALRALISARGVPCIFTEPEFEPAIVRTVAEGTGAKIATLDPEGASLAPGPEFYFTLMRRIAGDLRGCLIASGG
jgi:zinc transport system substrate-binding protein